MDVEPPLPSGKRREEGEGEKGQRRSSLGQGGGREEREQRWEKRKRIEKKL